MPGTPGPQRPHPPQPTSHIAASRIFPRMPLQACPTRLTALHCVPQTTKSSFCSPHHPCTLRSSSTKQATRGWYTSAQAPKSFPLLSPPFPTQQTLIHPFKATSVVSSSVMPLSTPTGELIICSLCLYDSYVCTCYAESQLSASCLPDYTARALEVGTKHHSSFSHRSLNVARARLQRTTGTRNCIVLLGKSRVP